MGALRSSWRRERPPEVVRALVEAGASVDQGMENGAAALRGGENGHLEVVRALVEAGASVDQAKEYAAHHGGAGRPPRGCARWWRRARAWTRGWRMGSRHSLWRKNGHLEVVRALVRRAPTYLSSCGERLVNAGQHGVCRTRWDH